MDKKVTFHLTISKVHEVLFSGEAVSLTVPGVEGELTILAYHVPFISQLKAGTLKVRTVDNTESFTITQGFVETSNGQVTVLV